MNENAREYTSLVTPDTYRALLDSISAFYANHVSKRSGRKDMFGSQYAGTMENFGNEILLEARKLKMDKPPLDRLNFGNDFSFYFDFAHADLLDTYDQQTLMHATLKENVLLSNQSYRLKFEDCRIETVLRSNSSSGGQFDPRIEPEVVRQRFLITKTPPTLMVHRRHPEEPIDLGTNHPEYTSREYRLVISDYYMSEAHAFNLFQKEHPRLEGEPYEDHWFRYLQNRKETVDLTTGEIGIGYIDRPEVQAEVEYIFFLDESMEDLISIKNASEPIQMVTVTLSNKWAGRPLIWFTSTSYKTLPFMNWERRSDTDLQNEGTNARNILTVGMDGNHRNWIYPFANGFNVPSMTALQVQRNEWFVELVPWFDRYVSKPVEPIWNEDQCLKWTHDLCPYCRQFEEYMLQYKEDLARFERNIDVNIRSIRFWHFPTGMDWNNLNRRVRVIDMPDDFVRILAIDSEAMTYRRPDARSPEFIPWTPPTPHTKYPSSDTNLVGTILPGENYWSSRSTPLIAPRPFLVDPPDDRNIIYDSRFPGKNHSANYDDRNPNIMRAVISLRDFAGNGINLEDPLKPILRVLFDHMFLHDHEFNMGGARAGINAGKSNDIGLHGIPEVNGVIHGLGEFEGLPAHMSPEFAEKRRQYKRSHVEVFNIRDELNNVNQSILTKQLSAVLIDGGIPSEEIGDIIEVINNLNIVITFDSDNGEMRLYRTTGQSWSNINALTEKTLMGDKRPGNMTWPGSIYDLGTRKDFSDKVDYTLDANGNAIFEKHKGFYMNEFGNLHVGNLQIPDVLEDPYDVPTTRTQHDLPKWVHIGKRDFALDPIDFEFVSDMKVGRVYYVTNDDIGYCNNDLTNEAYAFSIFQQVHPRRRVPVENPTRWETDEEFYQRFESAWRNGDFKYADVKPPLTAARIADVPTSFFQLMGIRWFAPTNIIDPQYVRSEAGWTEELQRLVWNGNRNENIEMRHRWVRTNNPRSIIFPHHQALPSVASLRLTHPNRIRMNPRLDINQGSPNVTWNVNMGGTGYQVGDTIRVLIGGKFFTSTVTQISAGRVVNFTPPFKQPKMIEDENGELIPDPETGMVSLSILDRISSFDTTGGHGTGFRVQMTVGTGYWNSLQPGIDGVLDGLFTFQYDEWNNIWIRTFNNRSNVWEEGILFCGEVPNIYSQRSGWEWNTMEAAWLYNNLNRFHVNPSRAWYSDEAVRASFDSSAFNSTLPISESINNAIDRSENIVGINKQGSMYALIPSDRTTGVHPIRRFDFHSWNNTQSLNAGFHLLPFLHGLELPDYFNRSNQFALTFDHYGKPPVYTIRPTNFDWTSFLNDPNVNLSENQSIYVWFGQYTWVFLVRRAHIFIIEPNLTAMLEENNDRQPVIQVNSVLWPRNLNRLTIEAHIDGSSNEYEVDVVIPPEQFKVNRQGQPTLGVFHPHKEKIKIYEPYLLPHMAVEIDEEEITFYNTIGTEYNSASETDLEEPMFLPRNNIEEVYEINSDGVGILQKNVYLYDERNESETMVALKEKLNLMQRSELVQYCIDNFRQAAPVQFEGTGFAYNRQMLIDYIISNTRPEPVYEQEGLRLFRRKWEDVTRVNDEGKTIGIGEQPMGAWDIVNRQVFDREVRVFGGHPVQDHADQMHIFRFDQNAFPNGEPSLCEFRLEVDGVDISPYTLLIHKNRLYGWDPERGTHGNWRRFQTVTEVTNGTSPTIPTGNVVETPPTIGVNTSGGDIAGGAIGFINTTPPQVGLCTQPNCNGLITQSTGICTVCGFDIRHRDPTEF